MIYTQTLLELQQLDVILQPGHEVLLPSNDGNLARRNLARLHYQLSLLINRVYEATRSLPAVGDELVLQADVLRAWQDTPEGMPTRWRVEQRGYLTPDKTLHVGYRLRRMLDSGPGEEIEGEYLLVAELVSKMPTKACQRTLQRWLSSPGRPIRTWEQLARFGHELPSERGFNEIHLRYIKQELIMHGLELL